VEIKEFSVVYNCEHLLKDKEGGGIVLIYDIMDGVRERPALYMGSKSITVLQNFLFGAVYTSHILGIDDGYDEFSPIPFRFFNDYVAHFYDYFESTSGWMNIILNKNNNNEEASFDIFYMLLDMFRSINISKIQKCILTQEQIIYCNKNECGPFYVLPPDSTKNKGVLVDPKAVYLIELSDNAGFLWMIELKGKSYFCNSLFKKRMSAIESFHCYFGGSFQWYAVKKMPCNLERI